MLGVEALDTETYGVEDESGIPELSIDEEGVLSANNTHPTQAKSFFISVSGPNLPLRDKDMMELAVGPEQVCIIYQSYIVLQPFLMACSIS